MTRALRFSANLGFLWLDLPLPARIAAAAAAGFDAVECHFPYDTEPDAVADALAAARLPMISLNAPPGDLAAGEFGLAALPGRSADARDAIDAALAYADHLDCPMIHVMAGKTDDPAAPTQFRRSLAYALARTERTILIEPMNPHDAPGYHLRSLEQAEEVIADLDAPNLRIMFDCYHIARMGLDPLAEYTAHRRAIAHVQFAGVPDRGPPDTGTLDLAQLLPALDHPGHLGAEYRPPAATEDSLGWLDALRNGAGAA